MESRTHDRWPTTTRSLSPTLYRSATVLTQNAQHWSRQRTGPAIYSGIMYIRTRQKFLTLISSSSFACVDSSFCWACDLFLESVSRLTSRSCICRCSSVFSCVSRLRSCVSSSLLRVNSSIWIFILFSWSSSPSTFDSAYSCHRTQHDKGKATKWLTVLFFYNFSITAKSKVTVRD